METIKLNTRTDEAGTLRLELSTQLTDRDVEVIVVLQPRGEQPTDALGWPRAFFESIDALDSDDIRERPEQGGFDEREPIE